MDDKRFDEITELVNNAAKYSPQEFDKLVSDEEYKEWSLEANARINKKVNSYLKK